MRSTPRKRLGKYAGSDSIESSHDLVRVANLRWPAVGFVVGPTRLRCQPCSGVFAFLRPDAEVASRRSSKQLRQDCNCMQLQGHAIARPGLHMYGYPSTDGRMLVRGRRGGQRRRGSVLCAACSIAAPAVAAQAGTRKLRRRYSAAIPTPAQEYI